MVLAGEKILLTGATGTLGAMMARALAPHNEVWGLARYSDPMAADVARQSGLVPDRRPSGQDSF